jgi:hypothetical protein
MVGSPAPLARYGMVTKVSLIPCGHVVALPIDQRIDTAWVAVVVIACAHMFNAAEMCFSGVHQINASRIIEPIPAPTHRMLTDGMVITQAAVRKTAETKSNIGSVPKTIEKCFSVAGLNLAPVNGSVHQTSSQLRRTSRL